MSSRPSERSAPGPRADPATLRALGRGRALARGLADDLLTHVPDLGDLATQRALDAWVEQAADTLRAVSEALEERLMRLAVDPSARPSGPPAGSQSPSPVPSRPASRTERPWT